MFSISDCHTTGQRKKFEEIAEELNGTAPEFIPPFPGSVAKYLSSDSAFCRRHGEIHAFMAFRDGKPVGRIAAIINRSHNSRYNDRTGFFGYYECEDNPETAAALLAKAEDFLRSKGMTSMRGPYSPSINDECGLLVHGFDIPAVTGLTWNPAYYKDQLLRSGLKTARKLHCFLLPMHRLETPPRLTKIVKYLRKRSNMTVRPIKLNDLPNELAIVREVYNATLERNWGFVPIEMEDLLAAADDIKAIADPKLLLIGEIDGENAGVALTLPNFNEILAHIRKTPKWLRLPHILWLMKTRKINSCRQTVLGVSPRFRDKGLHALLLHDQFTLAKERHANATLGWVEENNTEILENCHMMGGYIDRTWEIFEKELTVSP